jgi:hypothetical protein
MNGSAGGEGSFLGSGVVVFHFPLLVVCWWAVGLRGRAA